MRQPLGGRREAGLVLDGVNQRDLVEPRFGDRRFRRPPHLEDVAAGMSPAGNLGDRHRPRGTAPPVIECFEPGIGVGLEKASKLREVLRRMLATAIGAVEVGSGRRCRAAEWPVVADIDP